MTKCFEIFVILGLLVFQVTFRAACFLVIPGLCFLLSSPGTDPGIHISKHNLDRGKQWSNAGLKAQCYQLAAHLPCRSSPGFLFLLSSPGSDPGIHISKHNLDHRKQWSNAVSVAQCYQLAARLPCRSSPRMTVPLC